MSLFSRKAQEFEFTGNCPIRQHTGDGDFVGRCYHSTYGGRCPSHGDVTQFLEEGADLSDADDRRLPPREQMDFGPPSLRRKLGVRG